MIYSKAFEEWFESTGLIDRRAVHAGWQACEALMQKHITELEAWDGRPYLPGSGVRNPKFDIRVLLRDARRFERKVKRG